MTVKLFGTLCQEVPNYDPNQGMKIEMTHGARVKDLVALLNIPPSSAPVVAMEGHILHSEEELSEGAMVQVLQPVHGG